MLFQFMLTDFRSNIDLSALTKDETHRIKVKLKEIVEVEILVFLTITGTTLINTIYDADDYNIVGQKIQDMKKKYVSYLLDFFILDQHL